MKIRFLFLLTGLFVSYQLLAQTVFQGTIVNEQQEPLAGTVIACFRNSDNNLMRGTTTDEYGKFKIEVKHSGEWIRISYLGYENIDYKDITSLPTHIIMKPASMELGEVVVQGKSIVTQKSDRLVFSIANSNLTKGNNVNQLLRFTPMMDVDGENISILGKNGMQLYVNGRKSRLRGVAMQSYLRGLPAENIEKIEVITDPGSEFQVDENEGIINLILKKNENQGWKGTISLNDRIGVYNSYNGNLYLDYQKDKLYISISAYGNKNRERYNQDIQYEYLEEGLQNDNNKTTRLNHKIGGGNINIDYLLSDKHTLGAIVNGYYAQRNNDIDIYTKYKKIGSNVLDSIVYTLNYGDNTAFNLAANLNYRWKTDDKGSKFSIDADYLRVYNVNDESLANSLIDKEITKEPYTHFCQNTNNVYNTWSSSITYQHFFTPSQNLQIGAGGYLLKGYNKFFYGNYNEGNYVSDPTKTNHFNMEENYLAAYVTHNSQWNKKFSSNLGIRSEYTYRHGHLASGNENVKREYFYILPSISANFRPNNDHQFAYSLSTHVIHPPLTSLNPFLYYLSPTVYRENNPDVKSVYNLSTSLRYIFKSHYIVSAMFITGKIMTSFPKIIEGGYTQITTESFGRQHTGILTLSWNDSFFNNCLSLNASCNGVYNRAYGTLEQYKVDVSDLSLQTSLNVNWSFSKRYNWSMNSTFRYRTATEQADYIGNDFYALNWGVRKVFKNDISFNFGVDFLLTSTDQRNFFTDNYRSYNHIDYHFRKFYIGCSIPFGRKKVSGAEWRSGSSSMGKERLN